MSHIISDEFANSYKNKKVPWGFNGLGYIVYKRTYARNLENGKKEEWYQTIQRCINGAQKIGADYTQEEAEQLFDLIFNLKCNFAGRMLWQLGTSTVDRFGANSLLNCWFVKMNEAKAFLFLFENLMLGGGVGFSIRREDIHELPKVKRDVKIEHQLTKDADLICADSRQGWIRLLEQLLKSFFITGKSFTYSTILVRGYGEIIKGFGGTASGPGILIEGIEKITKIFQSREGKKLRSIDVLDICNIIGSIVVAGNVRRSSEIALGDPDDHLFIRAKNWSTGKIPNTRNMSNNTIYADEFEHISDDIWNIGYEIDPITSKAKGEPYGFFNLPLSQKFGRISDGLMSKSDLYPKDSDPCEGGNPCNEISLCHYECCNLSELYLNNIESEKELFDCSKLLYKTQKAVAAMNFLHEETNQVVHKNMRLGMGVTGVCQSLDKLEWLDKCYRELRKFDKEWSKSKNYPESIKLTTQKPSGTLSLLAGATPGIHPAYSKYYIRRVRMSCNDPLVEICREMGYHVEYQLNLDLTEDRTTFVIQFPCEAGEKALVAAEIDAVKQLELVKKMQSIWSDNSISVTVYYKVEELFAIKEWLKENYENNIKSVSFLLHSGHAFLQAPYEEVTKEKYLQLKSKVKDLTLLDINDGEMESMECSNGGSCPIR